VLTPPAADPTFVDWLIRTCREYDIRGILSGVEPVLMALAEHRAQIESSTGARVLVSEVELLKVCGDKLRTAEWLHGRGLNAARSADSRDTEGVAGLVAECGHHLFAKPRRGKGSLGVFAVRTAADLDRATRLSDYVIQELLGDSAHEFTASTFTDRGGVLRGCIVMRRELKDGTTVFAQIVDEPSVKAEAIAIARALQPTGPCNMQFRTVDGRAVCFEINLRYSGTTPIRAHFGFNDVEAGVRNFVLDEPIGDLPEVVRGTALRFWNEIYLDERAWENWTAAGTLADPRRYLRRFETFRRAP
jgi:carbamoyl-phosphate synthase large subunit